MSAEEKKEPLIPVSTFDKPADEQAKLSASLACRATPEHNLSELSSLIKYYENSIDNGEQIIQLENGRIKANGYPDKNIILQAQRQVFLARREIQELFAFYKELGGAATEAAAVTGIPDPCAHIDSEIIPIINQKYTLQLKHKPEFSLAQMDPGSCQHPEFPRISIINEESGTVRVGFLIGVNGDILYSTVIKSSGYKPLDLLTLESLDKCKFKPGAFNGSAIESWAKTDYVFKIMP
jgi:protein TonB